jgi:hypothetical protein
VRGSRRRVQNASAWGRLKATYSNFRHPRRASQTPRRCRAGESSAWRSELIGPTIQNHIRLLESRFRRHGSDCSYKATARMRGALCRSNLPSRGPFGRNRITQRACRQRSHLTVGPTGLAFCACGPLAGRSTSAHAFGAASRRTVEDQ